MGLNDVLSLFDSQTILEVSALLFGTGLSTLFYSINRQYENSADKVAKAPLLSVDKHLLTRVKEADDSCLQYVAISGAVTSNESLQSQYFPEKKGVFLNLVTEEHKEVWAKYTNAWFDSTREVSNVVDSVPFSLKDRGDVSVHVINPIESTWFMQNLDVTYKEYRPATSSFMGAVMGIISGDRVRGFTDTEKMLRIGTQLLGIGELFLDDGVLKLRKPCVGNGDYILTKLSYEEIIKSYRSKSKLWKILCFVFAGATAFSIYYVLKQLMKRYKHVLEEKRIKEECYRVRRERSRLLKSNRNNENRNPTEDVCAICLTNPRECVILDCGHVCCCLDCFENLPVPKTCPVCRSHVLKIIPLFHA